MPYVYKEVDSLKANTPIAGTGQCVEIVKTYVPGLQGLATSAWRSGDNVMEQGNRIARGTAIATFNKSGRYPNIAHGNHAALVLRVMGSGIWVVEQWKNISGGVIKIRLIRVPPPRQQFNTDGSYKDPSNNALAFRTIER